MTGITSECKNIWRPNPVMEKAVLFESHNCTGFHKISAFFNQQKLQKEMFGIWLPHVCMCVCVGVMEEERRKNNPIKHLFFRNVYFLLLCKRVPISVSSDWKQVSAELSSSSSSPQWHPPQLPAAPFTPQQHHLSHLPSKGSEGGTHQTPGSIMP